LKLLHTFLGEKGQLDRKLDLKKGNLPNANKAIMTYLAFSVVWSLGANLHDTSR
jgi:hypothetical protein